MDSRGRPSAPDRRVRPGRNIRLLVQAAAQHLVDDPAFFAIQASRRLPFPVRVRVGVVLERAALRYPGVGALGAMMAGHQDAAIDALRRNLESGRSPSRLGGEVAILLDRPDLLPQDAPAATRARAAWARGELREAVQILEHGGVGASSHARRLRSEIALVTAGHSLPLRNGDAGSSAAADISTSTERPLRVLHILTNSLPHTQSGYSLRSHRILTALRREGIESVALTRTGYPVMIGMLLARDEDVVDDIRYVRSLPRTLPRTQEERLQHQIEQAIRLVEEFRPDVLHATTNYLTALVAQTVSRATGIPWVLEVRGFMEQTWVASHSTDEGRKAARSSEKTLLIARREAELAEAADAVVTLSRTMADELVSRGVPGDRIHLAPNGVDDSLFERGMAPRKARAAVGLDRCPDVPGDAILLGAASALVDYEGFDTLLHALALLVEDDSTPASVRDRLHVVLVGDGAARPGLVALADELGLSGRVHLPGRVERGAARRWVEALDVVIIPRLDLDVARLVTPQKPIEALALGRPVIASNLPALRESLSTAVGEPSARFFAPGSARELQKAIRCTVLDPSSADEHIERGRVIARDRSWSGVVGRYRDVYTQVLAERQGGSENAR